MIERKLEIRRLHGARPRSRLVRWSVLAMVLLVAYAWLGGDFSPAELF